jgi:putative DNA methylase
MVRCGNEVALILRRARLSRSIKNKKCKDAGETPAFPGRGWHSRGYLPHFDQAHLIQSITFRLADSLPASRLAALEQELAFIAEAEREVERRRAIEAALDAGHGACHLRKKEIAALVEHAFFHFDGDRYRLLAWCVMPNHVHVLAQMLQGYALEDIMHSWKSFTSKEVNKLLSRRGSFWMPEYYDRFIRDEAHFHNALSYIERNLVKAGLVGKAEDWPFGSARLRAGNAGVSPAVWKEEMQRRRRDV